jgi:hypothetical protein
MEKKNSGQNVRQRFHLVRQPKAASKRILVNPSAQPSLPEGNKLSIVVTWVSPPLRHPASCPCCMAALFFTLLIAIVPAVAATRVVVMIGIFMMEDFADLDACNPGLISPTSV